VTIGDGKFAKFWSSSWIEGKTLKNFAPTLFKKSRRKNITVYKALENNHWISHITPLQTPQEIREYVAVWEAVGHT
jgi:hypothetical protein